MAKHEGTLVITLTSGESEEEYSVAYTASLDSPDPSVGIEGWTVQDISIDRIEDLKASMSWTWLRNALEDKLNSGEYDEKIIEDFLQNPPGRDPDDLRDEQIDRELNEK